MKEEAPGEMTTPHSAVNNEIIFFHEDSSKVEACSIERNDDIRISSIILFNLTPRLVSNVSRAKVKK